MRKNWELIKGNRNHEKSYSKRKVIVSIGIAAVLISLAYAWYQNQHVQFEDKNMAIVICNTIGGVTPENVRYKDLRKVEEIKTGYVGYYETLIDIKKCKQLKVLDINSTCREGDAAYKVTGNNPENVGKIMEPGEVKELQEELGEIVSHFRKLKEFSFTNAMKNCGITNIDFLENCTDLETVWIYHCNVTDYSALKKCLGLKHVYLTGSKIEYAGDLLELENVEEMFLDKTPLSRNKKELQKLFEAFPDAKIIN